MANRGIVIAYDSRPQSQELASIMAATLHYHFKLVRVFFISIPCTPHFMAFYMQHLKKVLGILVTGGSLTDSFSGLMFFQGNGDLISSEVSNQIESNMIKFSEKQLYMKDLSRAYDYFEKKF
jgi:phosphomannomutase